MSISAYKQYAFTVIKLLSQKKQIQTCFFQFFWLKCYTQEALAISKSVFRETVFTPPSRNWREFRGAVNQPEASVIPGHHDTFAVTRTVSAFGLLVIV